MSSDRMDLPQGTLDLLILKAVALEPQHGWAISERLHQISSATLLDPPRFALSRASPPRETWMDQSALGCVRQQSSRQVLRVDPPGTCTARGPDNGLAEARCNRRSDPRNHLVGGGRCSPTGCSGYGALFKRTTVEREIDDELRFHFDHQVDSYVARGLERAEAVRLARLEFGGLDQVKEEYRDALGVRLIDGFSRDLRLALRSLRSTPIVTTVAILSLALGIGANTAIFSLIDSLVLRPLPVSCIRSNWSPCPPAVPVPWSRGGATRSGRRLRSNRTLLAAPSPGQRDASIYRQTATFSRSKEFSLPGRFSRHSACGPPWAYIYTS